MQIYWNESEQRLDQMCGGGTGRETTLPINSLFPSGAMCNTFSWLKHVIQLSKHVCVGVHEGGQTACENNIMETREVDDSARRHQP